MAFLRRAGLVLIATFAFCLPSQAIAIGSSDDRGSDQPDVSQSANPR